MKKGETALQQRIQKAVKAEFNAWLTKIHGGPFQAAGIPDLVGCVDGFFVALEVKMPDTGRVSEIQKLTIERIREAGGCADVVTSPEQALRVIRRHLEAARPIPAKSRKICSTGKDRGTVLRTRNGKDVDIRRAHRTARRWGFYDI